MVWFVKLRWNIHSFYEKVHVYSVIWIALDFPVWIFKPFGVKVDLQNYSTRLTCIANIIYRNLHLFWPRRGPTFSMFFFVFLLISLREGGKIKILPKPRIGDSGILDLPRSPLTRDYVKNAKIKTNLCLTTPLPF